MWHRDSRALGSCLLALMALSSLGADDPRLVALSRPGRIQHLALLADKNASIGVGFLFERGEFVDLELGAAFFT